MVKVFRKHTPEQIVRKIDRVRILREASSTTTQIRAELGICETTLSRR